MLHGLKGDSSLSIGIQGSARTPPPPHRRRHVNSAAFPNPNRKKNLQAGKINRWRCSNVFTSRRSHASSAVCRLFFFFHPLARFHGAPCWTPEPRPAVAFRWLGSFCARWEKRDNDRARHVALFSLVSRYTMYKEAPKRRRRGAGPQLARATHASVPK